MKIYQITYEWPNGDWTWIDVKVENFHEAVHEAVTKCPDLCKVKSIELIPSVHETLVEALEQIRTTSTNEWIVDRCDDALEAADNFSYDCQGHLEGDKDEEAHFFVG